ncbi:MAG TPA: hypothetical protein VH136_16905 [Trebonia sp.]|nr:hypothetical protein [Trebonia sp.]
MRSIARLLFGPEEHRIADLFVPGEHDEHSMAERVRQAGEWCQTTPGRSRIHRRPLHSQPTLGRRRSRG